MAEKRFTGSQRNATQIAAGKNHGVLVNRISRARAKNDIARINSRPGKMGYAFLGANRNDRLGIGIEVDLVALLVPVADRHAQLINAAGYRIAMVLWFACG